MGLADLWGDCRPELPKGGKYQMVQTDGRSGICFPLRFARGRLEFVTQAFGDSPKLSSSGLVIP